MIFGIYCEVQIETLRQIKLKYVEDYESLVQFLTDFHLLVNKPSILAIDSLDYYLEHRNLQPCTKRMRMHLILSLAADARRFLAPNKTVFPNDSLIIAYRCAPNQSESQDQHQQHP